MRLPLIDLHCDLLGCIEPAPTQFNFDSPEINCSLPQLIAGGVACQAMAIFAYTEKGSTHSAERQLLLYQKLLNEHADRIQNWNPAQPDLQRLNALLAIENASALAEEDDPLELAFQRLERFAQIGKILYVSLTWNQENRFGGGNCSQTGLKADGKAFLKFLSGKNIAIDLSHTSDALAEEILNYIDQASLALTPIASHSNFRTIKNVARNLPDPLAREIIARKGLIGLNFVKRFVGEQPEDFLKHIEHGLELGAAQTLCLGADFYGGLDIPTHLMPDRSLPVFHPPFSNSSCYPAFFTLLQTKFSSEQIASIAYRNALAFFQRT